MNSLQHKNVILGITGSIAAYKAAEIIRLLKKREARVFPVMTEAATHFVHPVTYQSLAGEKVRVSLFENKSGGFKHISLCELADALLIAPATANIIGKIASGIADDILTTTTLAARVPVAIAPAMNNRMYENLLVQENIHKLESIGYRFIGPEEGELACGDRGKGRMSEPEKIVDFLEEIFSQKNDLQGRCLVITAGPTREAIDKVRFISNYSSGKMGFALAQEAKMRGATVTLISGPTCIEPPSGITVHKVQTAEQMLEKVRKNFKDSHCLIMAAAVSDFRPSSVADKKLKKGEKEKLSLQLVKVPDILEEIGKQKQGKVTVGFCAETEDLVEEAKRKLNKKKLDLVVANDITEQGAGFGVDTNRVVLIDARGKVTSLPLMSKREVARAILDYVKKLL